jgi:hypothetical protein
MCRFNGNFGTSVFICLKNSDIFLEFQQFEALISAPVSMGAKEL